MRKAVMMGMAALLVSMPAHAWVRVTNLSGTPQSVTYSTAGTDTRKVIAHYETITFVGNEGMLSLNDPATIAKAQNAEPGVGGKVLGDIIGSNRTSRIPAVNGDRYVIWPDGRLLIQKRLGSNQQY